MYELAQEIERDLLYPLHKKKYINWLSRYSKDRTQLFNSMGLFLPQRFLLGRCMSKAFLFSHPIRCSRAGGFTKKDILPPAQMFCF